ncbi:MAG: M42 family peptidase, partial [Ruminococcus sp.]|nr:M42 family peptidase [Ruminococcus sp.]
DRFGCYVMIELIKSDLEYDADFAFVVQEEVGLRGSKTAAYTLDPAFALVLETTTSAEIPEIEPQKQVCTLGDGAVISVMDRRTIYDKELVRCAMETAQALGVKAQYKRAVAGGNDAGAIHQSRGGVRTLAISLACRYLHAPSTVASKADCESMLALARAMCEKIAGGDL